MNVLVMKMLIIELHKVIIYKLFLDTHGWR